MGDRVLLVGYATYSRDARIRSYARALRNWGASYEVWALSEEHTPEGEPVVHYGRKYQGASAGRYLLSYFSFFFATMGRALLHPRRFRLIHCHNMPNFLVFAFWLNKLCGARIVLDVHDLMPVLLSEKIEGRWALRCAWWEQHLSAAFADHVITADDNQRDCLVERGVPLAKTSVRLNLPNPGIFPRVAISPRASEFRLVYHGTVAARLGLDLAVRAVALARKRVPGIRFHILGQGDDLPRVRRLVAELELGEIVECNGRFLPLEELPARLATMDAGLVPSRRTPATERYMLPVKLLEYVWLGKPVIAPDLPILRRYFGSDMLHYYLCEDVEAMADAIVALALSPERGAELAGRAARFYRHNTWQGQAQVYRDVLRNLGLFASG